MLPEPFERKAWALVRGGHGLTDLCVALDGLLRQVVPYGAAAWATHDPATGLTTSCTLTGIPRDQAREDRIFRSEFDDDEPSTYLSLITAGATVAVLSEVTGGDLNKAARFRDVFSAFGVTDELRAILWAREQPWGSLSLYRMGTTFGPEQSSLVAQAAPLIAEGLRLALLQAAAARPQRVDDPPGILDVGGDGAVTAATVPGRRWLDLAGEPLRTAARVAAAALRERQDWQGASSRLVAPDGRVLTLHAAESEQPGNHIAVIVESARPAEVAAMLVDAYGLTSRQRDVLGHLLLGRSITQIAHRLEISEHTVNDHRKVIYTAFGVSSRSELAAILQAERYDPLVGAHASPSPYGGFLADS